MESDKEVLIRGLSVDIPGIREHLNDWKLRAAFVASMLLATACGSPVKGNPDQTGTGPGSPAATSELTPAANLPIVPNQPAPKETSTPEVKTIECLINDPEACKTARMVKIGGKEYVAIRTASEIPLVTRLNGEITVTEAEAPFQGVFISIANRDTTETENFYGNISAKINPLWVPITDGSPIGTTPKGEEIFIRLTKRGTGGIALDKERTEKAFPGISAKPIEDLGLDGQTKQSISYKYEG